jgi:hypothetical protein
MENGDLVYKNDGVSAMFVMHYSAAFGENLGIRWKCMNSCESWKEKMMKWKKNDFWQVMVHFETEGCYELQYCLRNSKTQQLLRIETISRQVNAKDIKEEIVVHWWGLLPEKNHLVSPELPAIVLWKIDPDIEDILDWEEHGGYQVSFISI